MFSAGYQPVTINSRIETEEVLGPLPDDWEVGEFFYRDALNPLSFYNVFPSVPKKLFGALEKESCL